MVLLTRLRDLSSAETRTFESFDYMNQVLDSASCESAAMGNMRRLEEGVSKAVEGRALQGSSVVQVSLFLRVPAPPVPRLAWEPTDYGLTLRDVVLQQHADLVQKYRVRMKDATDHLMAQPNVDLSTRMENALGTKGSAFLGFVRTFIASTSTANAAPVFLLQPDGASYPEVAYPNEFEGLPYFVPVTSTGPLGMSKLPSSRASTMPQLATRLDDSVVIGIAVPVSIVGAVIIIAVAAIAYNRSLAANTKRYPSENDQRLTPVYNAASATQYDFEPAPVQVDSFAPPQSPMSSHAADPALSTTSPLTSFIRPDVRQDSPPMSVPRGMSPRPVRASTLNAAAFANSQPRALRSALDNVPIQLTPGLKGYVMRTGSPVQLPPQSLSTFVNMSPSRGGIPQRPGLLNRPTFSPQESPLYAALQRSILGSRYMRSATNEAGSFSNTNATFRHVLPSHRRM
jgi:hypothetical protein